MPLPDERPRQSVANLIGRFETQNKRPPLRSPSVVSHNTGDSVNHEPKEKREWPPRSVSERIASLESPTPRPRATLPPSQSAPQPSTVPMILEPSTSSGASTVMPADDPIPVIETKSEVENQADDNEVAAPVAMPPPVPSPRSPPRSPPATAKPTVIKGTPSVSSRPAARTTSKSTTARHSSGAPIIPPLKPHHTGLSTASTASTRKLAASPIPSKSPNRSAFAATARPKTPSSGLHAPTAASLARSRNAAVASTSTTPVKKSALTASASDRLNKPTAASLSRARIPLPPVAQPSRPNTRSAATPTKVTTKLKATSSPAKKSSPVKKPATAAKTDIGTDAATVEVASHDVQSEAVDHNEPVNGHSPEEHVEDSSPSEGATEQVKEHTESDIHEAVEVNAEKGADVHPESDVDASMEMANEGTPTEVEPAPSVSIVGANQSFEQDFRIEQGDDIDFMVKILESVTIPQVRPVSIATIPDEVHEIPDEE